MHMLFDSATSIIPVHRCIFPVVKSSGFGDQSVEFEQTVVRQSYSHSQCSLFSESFSVLCVQAHLVVPEVSHGAEAAYLG